MIHKSNGLRPTVERRVNGLGNLSIFIRRPLEAGAKLVHTMIVRAVFFRASEALE